MTRRQLFLYNTDEQTRRLVRIMAALDGVALSPWLTRLVRREAERRGIVPTADTPPIPGKEAQQAGSIG